MVSKTPLLEAADDLRLEPDGLGVWRVAWGEEDWLGPVSLGLDGAASGPALASAHEIAGRDALGVWRGFAFEWKNLPLPISTSVRAYRSEALLVFRTEARDDVEGLATGSFSRPALAWPWLRPTLRRRGGVPDGTRGYAHQYTEFAFPTFSGASLADFFLFPHRPRVVAPLWLNAPDGRSLMLAPLDAFHDQVMAVPRGPERSGEGVRCGWHGDLASAPRGFATELALWAGPGPRVALERWASHLRQRYGTRRLSRYADASVAQLSYWTDNGAAYWYRTEPGLDMAATLEAVAKELAERRVPVGAFELDSWFYPHETTQPLNPGGDEHVPPTGALLWEPRPDVLPDGIPSLRRRIGNAPLIAHARHFSSRSPYFERELAWIDGDRAHPQDPAFFGRLLAQAADWGVATVEQDWLVEMYLGVRGLRERPGRARAWQQAMDRAAAEHGVTLLWCMATPADFLETLGLDRIVSIRTSGDYRYLAGNPAHWVRFLYTNALARALGLHPFKDVFLSDPTGTGLDGDPYAEAEALLAALSAGPVGIGDRVGRTDPAMVLRTCREDGVLIKPDVPIAALERCMRADAYFEPEPLIGECWSDHPAGRWSYVAAFNAWKEERELEVRLPLLDLGEAWPRGPVLCVDWRTRSCELLAPEAELSFTLAPGDWRFFVLCPVLVHGIVLVGDLSRYACAGDRRLRNLRVLGDAVQCEVLGAPGERWELSGWAAGPIRAEAAGPGERAHVLTTTALENGTFSIPLEIGPRGWRVLRLTAE